MTHDYRRNGTTTLFAALNVLNGQVIAECRPRHRHQEFLRFLRRLDREVPKELDLHLILDNYQTHKHEKVRRWLARRRRFHFHFIPTSSSWLNLVERWFAELTNKAVRRGSFESVPDLERTIYEFVAHSDGSARPFTWTAITDRILKKIKRCKLVAETQHYHVPSFDGVGAGINSSSAAMSSAVASLKRAAEAPTLKKSWVATCCIKLAASVHRRATSLACSKAAMSCSSPGNAASACNMAAVASSISTRTSTTSGHFI